MLLSDCWLWPDPLVACAVQWSLPLRTLPVCLAVRYILWHICELHVVLCLEH